MALQYQADSFVFQVASRLLRHQLSLVFPFSFFFLKARQITATWRIGVGHLARKVSQVVHPGTVITTSPGLKGPMMTHFWDSRKQSAVDAAKPFGTFQRNAKCQTGLTRWGGKKNSFFFYIVSFFKVFCSTQKQILYKEKNC